MSAVQIFYSIIAILVFDFLLGKTLVLLNASRMSDPVPEELDGVFDEQQYKKQQKYSRANLRFGILSSIFSFILIMGMFLFAGFAWLDELVKGITQNEILIALLFFGILMLASDLLDIPFSLYDTFVIEEKFGFNKTTPGTFFLDKIKSWFLGGIIGGGLLALIVWFYSLAGEYFWLYVWAVMAVFMIFMSMFYSNIIVPLFNKQEPLPEGELREEIEAFGNKAGFKIDNIYVINGSKRSTKANAYFTGLGKRKRIVLYDTFIEDLETSEIVAVLAHEIGHYKKKHTMISLFTGLLQTGFMLYLLSLFVNEWPLAEALGVKEPAFHISLIVFAILYSPVSLILGLIMNMLSRKNEYQADNFADSHGLGKELISGLKKLSSKNLSNLTPHPAYVFFHYLHPPLLQRLLNLKQKIKS